MSVTSARQLPTWLQAIAVALAALLAVALVFGRFAPADWSLPHWLEGDPLEVYARVQVAAGQPAHALTAFTAPARLGAPFGADWSAYPAPDKPVFTFTGILARSIGLIAAVQITSAAFFALNAVSFYLCARWLGRRWEWAAALALAFAFCNHNLRWGITLSLSQTFTLPPLVLLCAHAARHGTARVPGRWTWLGAVLGLWLGLGNPYPAFFAGVVAAGALALALFRRAPRTRLAPLLVFIGMLAAVFIAANAHYAWHHWHGPNASALARSQGDFALYALRPVDWFIPPADHRLAALAALGRAHVASHYGAGEYFYNYLGLAGAVGLVWLLAATLRRWRRPGRGAFDATLGLAWILAFGAAGGANSWLGAAGLDMFRAGTRIGIFAVVWVALFLCGRLSHATRRWPRAVSVALAMGFTVFVVWEQTPSLSARVARENNRARWDAHRELATGLERNLPAGAAVFQLPAVHFPEAGRTVTMGDYEHFLPFLASGNLRFSYGHLRTSPTAQWNSHVASLPAAEMAATLERAGFSALWIDRRGFADEAVGLVSELRLIGLKELPVSPTLPISVFRLRTVDHPALPDLTDPRLHDAWDNRPIPPGQPRLLALSGWYASEREPGGSWRWASQRARVGIWHDGPPARAKVSFASGGFTGRKLKLRANGMEAWSAALADGPAAPQAVELVLRTGLNELEWELVGRPVQPAGDARLLGFRIENLGVSLR